MHATNELSQQESSSSRFVVLKSLIFAKTGRKSTIYGIQSMIRLAKDSTRCELNPCCDSKVWDSFMARKRPQNRTWLNPTYEIAMKSCETRVSKSSRASLRGDTINDSMSGNVEVLIATIRDIVRLPVSCMPSTSFMPCGVSKKIRFLHLREQECTVLVNVSHMNSSRRICAFLCMRIRNFMNRRNSWHETSRASDEKLVRMTRTEQDYVRRCMTRIFVKTGAEWDFHPQKRIYVSFRISTRYNDNLIHIESMMYGSVT